VTVLERPDLIKRTNDEREQDHARESAALTEILKTRTADEWEKFLQARHIPAARVCATMARPWRIRRSPAAASSTATPRHRASRAVSALPVAAFAFAYDGPRIDTPPPAVGQHNEEVFAELGVAKPKTR